MDDLKIVPADASKPAPEPKSELESKPAPAGPDPKPELEKQAVPLEEVKPVVAKPGLGPQMLALGKYMAGTEVHTYAFSVAANVILSLFPFIVLLLTISRNVFHSKQMEAVVGDLMTSLLPTGAAMVMRNAHPQKGMQIFSIAMLLISSTGVFLPLEVALNAVWGVKKNRNYLQNQIVSIGLAAAVGALALASVGLTAGQRGMMRWIFFGHTENVVFNMLAGGVLNFFAIIASILLFFLIYWILPNRKIPARAVLPTAIVIGVLWEIAKYIYVLMLPRLDFRNVYGPFQTTVGLMMWSFLSGLLLLAGAHFSATRYALETAVEETT
ncbi:membrane protein/epoxyqueuosine reductase [Granulicella rosea]|uniref:Membrane protein/epoxyqueuosine reductase n=1 Tax=Granulicella rosea TaxID=474952 RepID=A0A239IQS3_9BACT|nr:YihY/virulence factor BrkB family protein [Granulicella rosea]SNS94774.1 membrane protein/epoxyqueuosine reductase [Granulicella rosea]